MSKKRRNDYVLDKMTPEELLAYAKRITRDHGRAQESINRLHARVVQLEGALGEAAPAPAPAHQEPHRRTAPPPPAQHRRMVLRTAHRAGHE